MKTLLTPTKCGKTEFRWGEKTYIMGIVNLSPDSFSGDGIGGDIKRTVEQAQRMSIDDFEEELRLVIPAIKRLVKEIPVPISIDSYKSRVAEQALDAGASMINDIWGLKQDPSLARLAAERGVPIILMANERDAPPKAGIVAKVLADLENGIKIALKAGVPPENIIVDPGCGFGKTLEQNLELVNRLGELKKLGKPILLGTSRKSMIGLVLDRPADQRLEGNLALTAIGIANGADIVRVHDVKETALVCRMSDAIIRRGFIGE
jgi:dihydropteroate synthase